jgi:hypothetical protein
MQQLRDEAMKDKNFLEEIRDELQKLNVTTTCILNHLVFYQKQRSSVIDHETFKQLLKEYMEDHD